MLGMCSSIIMSLFQVPVLIKKKKKAVLMTHMFVKSERERCSHLRNKLDEMLRLWSRWSSAANIKRQAHPTSTQKSPVPWKKKKAKYTNWEFFSKLFFVLIFILYELVSCLHVCLCKLQTVWVLGTEPESSESSPFSQSLSHLSSSHIEDFLFFGFVLVFRFSRQDSSM